MMQWEVQKHPRDILVKQQNLQMIKHCYLTAGLQEREGQKHCQIAPVTGFLNSSATDTVSWMFHLEDLQHLSKNVTCGLGLDPDSENQRQRKHHETGKLDHYIFDHIKK